MTKSEILVQLQSVKSELAERYAITKIGIFGSVAGIEVDEGVDRYAYKQGLFVIKPSGETVEIINDSGFMPKSW